MNMTKHLLLAAAGAFAVPGLHAQDPTRAIEVASIRQASFPNDSYFAGWAAGSGDACNVGARRPVATGSRLNLSRITLCQLIVMGYGVQGFRIVGAPAWMMKLEPANYYNVQIKAEGEDPVTDEQARGLLRALITDRFHVTLHRDSSPLPVYVLAIGKNGTKIRETPEDGRPQRNGVSMASYVAFISRYLDRPVVDKTGLTGTNYAFAWDEKELREELQKDGTPAPSIFHAVEEQLGLTLKPSKEPLDVLVIDQAEKPTEN